MSAVNNLSRPSCAPVVAQCDVLQYNCLAVHLKLVARYANKSSAFRFDHVPSGNVLALLRESLRGADSNLQFVDLIYKLRPLEGGRPAGARESLVCFLMILNGPASAATDHLIKEIRSRSGANSASATGQSRSNRDDICAGARAPVAPAAGCRPQNSPVLGGKFARVSCLRTGRAVH